MWWRAGSKTLLEEADRERQTLNQQIGASLAIDIVSFADYPTRFQVMMAGGDFRV